MAVTAMPASCRYASVNTRLISPQAPKIQLNCCWFLSDVRWEALPARKFFSSTVGRLTSRLGLVSPRPRVTVRSTAASRRR